jgi:hypothetical protein
LNRRGSWWSFFDNTSGIVIIRYMQTPRWIVLLGGTTLLFSIVSSARATTAPPLIPASSPAAPGVSLEAELGSLRTELINLFAEASNQSIPFAFSRNLGFTSTGPDVKELQQFLNAKGYVVSQAGPGSPGNETSYFGAKTQMALVEFQKSAGIPATGYLGLITRSWIASHEGTNISVLGSTDAVTAPAATVQPPAASTSSTASANTNTITATSGGVTATLALPIVVSLAIAPATTSTLSGASTTFVASVGNTQNTGVTWSALRGTINASGIYTAPTVYATTTDIVTAVSLADTRVVASAQVTVNPLPITISVAAASSSLFANETTSIVATVLNASTSAVTWSATYGSITAQGIYTAPSDIGTSTIVDTITATSLANNTKIATTSVTVSSGIVGWWGFENATTSATSTPDYTSNNNYAIWHGAASGTIGYYNAGKVGSYAGAFNGSSTYAQVVDNPSTYFIATSSYTWSAWFNVATFNPASQTIVRRENGSTSGYDIYVQGNEIVMTFYGSGSGPTVTYQTAIASGNWYHFAVTYNGATSPAVVQFYLNGTLVTTSTATAFSDTADNIDISDQYGPGTFNGSIDDVRIYNRILSTSEIDSIFLSEVNNEALGTTAPLAAAAVGYLSNTFSSTFTSSTVDINQTKAPGYQWYFTNFYSIPPTPSSSVAINPDQSISLGTAGSSSDIATAVSLGGNNWRGTTFGGGAYFEATLKFSPAGVMANSSTWPAWWSQSIEHAASSGIGDYWIGQQTGYEHFIEPDFFEYDTWSFAGNSTYGGAVHDWFGVYGTTTASCANTGLCQINNTSGSGSKFSNSEIALPTSTDFTQYHTYGYLWVPATSSTLGYAQYYFDEKPTTDRIYWSQFVNNGTLAPPPSSSTPWTFGVMDNMHLLLELDAGASQGMQVQSVNVWQASAANNLSQ